MSVRRCPTPHDLTVWVCRTHAQAEMLVSRINTTMRNVRNVRIRETGYC